MFLTFCVCRPFYLNMCLVFISCDPLGIINIIKQSGGEIAGDINRAAKQLGKYLPLSPTLR